MDEEPLTFKNYSTTLYQCFAEMFDKKEFSDAILVCDNHRIHVHKFLLSASSSFFNNMFKKSQNKSLNITNVKYEDLQRVLEYIYKGEIALQPEKLSSFRDATIKLSVPVDHDKLRKLSRNSELIVKPSTAQDCNANVEKTCDGPVLKKDISSKAVELSKIDKHNLSKESSKSKIPGVVEVTREEFLKRMCRAHAIPWPGDDSDAVSPASTPSMERSIDQPSTSSMSSQSLPVKISKNIVQNEHSSSKKAVQPIPMPPSQTRPSALNNAMSIAETKRLIMERRKNIAGLQNRIKMLEEKGNGQKKLEKARKELKIHQAGLTNLQKLLPQS